MNYLVLLDTHTGELEKILSGLKTMVVRALDPAQLLAQPVRPGDGLYFLRENDEGILRVMASVVRVRRVETGSGQDLAHTLKALQPKLQFTEAQYNYWSAQNQVLLVEFEAAHKIGVHHVPSHILTNRSEWISFETLSHVTE